MNMMGITRLLLPQHTARTSSFPKHCKPFFSEIQRHFCWVSSSAQHASYFQKYSRTCVRIFHCSAPKKHRSLSKNGTKNRSVLDIDSQVTTDKVIFTFKNDRFYKYMSLFGIVQTLFWVNLASTVASTFANVDKKELTKRIDKDSYYGKIVSMPFDYAWTFSCLCGIAGAGILFFTILKPRRTIQRLTLLKGGEKVHIKTYNFLGRTRSFTVPTSHMSAGLSRQQFKGDISIKVKNKWFYFLLNNKGTFVEPQLYDHVIGLKRNFKT